MKPLLGHKRPIPAHVGVYAFVIIPFLALVAAVPFAWGWGLAWLDVILAAAFYTVTCLGATVGFHRYFTHGAFKATRALRVGLAVVGSMAVQGPILHSPWLFGTSPPGRRIGQAPAGVSWAACPSLRERAGGGCGRVPGAGGSRG